MLIAVLACLAGPVAGAAAQAPPETTIGSGPPAVSADTTPDFTFSSDSAGATFQCRLDDDGFAECEPQVTLGPLPDGTYVFQVRADNAGVLDETPATHTFTIDTTAPDTTVASGPPPLSNQAAPAFTFSATEAGRFQCSLHRAGEAPAFADCDPPYAPGSLGDGAWVFEVRAVDTAGNTDGSPASYGFQIDTAPPDTGITAGPADTTSAGAVFVFSSPDAARFSCRLDGGAWHACASPLAYEALGLGPHRFDVAAVDAAGNEDPSPASHAWQVLKPGLVIPGAVKQAAALAAELVQIRRALARVRLRRLARRGTVLFRSFDALTAGTVRIRARARVRRPWVPTLAGAREVPGAGRHPLRATVTRKGRRLARRRQTLPLELRLSFTDVAGRSLWATSRVTLER